MTIPLLDGLRTAPGQQLEARAFGSPDDCVRIGWIARPSGRTGAVADREDQPSIQRHQRGEIGSSPKMVLGLQMLPNGHGENEIVAFAPGRYPAKVRKPIAHPFDRWINMQPPPRLAQLADGLDRNDLVTQLSQPGRVPARTGPDFEHEPRLGRQQVQHRAEHLGARKRLELRHEPRRIGGITSQDVDFTHSGPR